MRRILACIVAFLSACALAADGPALTPALRQRIERQVRVYSAAPPDSVVELGKLRPAEMAGYYELPVTLGDGADSRSFTFLLSQDGKRLLYLKSFDLTEDPYARVMRSIDLSGRPTRGPANAPVTLVMYDDFQCPYCARMYITLFNQVMNHYRDRVRVVLKDFPITDVHPWAMDAAVAANCLNAAKPEAFWLFADYVHTHQQAMTADWNTAHDALARRAEKDAQQSGADVAAVRACVARHDVGAVEKSLAEGRSLGVSATPALFVNGAFYDGELSAEELHAALERALKEAESAAVAKP